MSLSRNRARRGTAVRDHAAIAPFDELVAQIEAGLTVGDHQDRLRWSAPSQVFEDLPLPSQSWVCAYPLLQLWAGASLRV